MAGLTALQRLQDQAEVTVFDKARGPGGRLSSKRVGEDSWDMGAQFIRAHSLEFRHALEHWQNEDLIQEWQVNPWLITSDHRGPSPDNTRRYVPAPRMTALSRQLIGAAHHFEASCRIVRTHYDGAWTLWDENDRAFGPFDGLIINVPPEQALPLLPPATALADTVGSLDMLPCWTLLMSFTSALDVPFDAAFVRDSKLGWVARNNSKPGRENTDAWVIQASHAWSALHKDAPRDQIQNAMIASFTELCSTPLPEVRSQWLHRWLFAVPAQSPGLGSLSDPECRLVLAGDWCQHGSVEGAWISGNHAAQQLLEMFA